MPILSPLLRHPNFATFPSLMNRFSCALRPLLSFMASATSRWWLPVHARRNSPLMVFPYPPARGVSRFPSEPRNMVTISQVEGEESGKPYMGPPISSANVITLSQDNKQFTATQGTKSIDTGGIILEVIAGDERSNKDACRVASETICVKHNTLMQVVKHTDCVKEDQRSAMDNHRGEIVASGDKVVSDDEEYTVNNVLEKSRHRDGSIYRGMDTWWKQNYYIANRNETRLEAMTYSDPTNCIIRNGTCMEHFPRRMLQILSIKLAKIPVDCGLVKLYGYIAVRDELDPLLNYVINLSRDHPIVVEQGSLINMAGPKRGIDMMDNTLIEYDMRVKMGEEEKDDLQLIDGASIIGSVGTWNQPFTFHIPGDYGAVDITLSRLRSAVEATVEVLLSEVQISFDLSLSCLSSGLNGGIWLFNGTIGESCGLKRSVVAILRRSSIDLKFEIDALSPSSSEQHCCSFQAKTHGHDTREIKTALAFISVKVTWSTLPTGLARPD
ncbi:unnamed protein product [Urochloa humidicola]